MAKCVRSVITWSPPVRGLESYKLSEDLQNGENQLKILCEETLDFILDIANDYILIKLTACHDRDRWDCCQVTEALTGKLHKLISKIASVTSSICTSQSKTATKHRYFILHSCGTIDRLKKLLQIVGRLSELDQALYLKEQYEPFISDESVTIHSLSTIWSAVIYIMRHFCIAGRELFSEKQDNLEDYNFIDDLEFSTAYIHHSKVLLMDLIITSWLQFNRLVKYDDLLQKPPLLCRCHTKLFFEILETSSSEGTDLEVLAKLLPLMLDHQREPSLLTQSARYHEIVPQEVRYSQINQSSRAYFVVWHLYSLFRLSSSNEALRLAQKMIFKCEELIVKYFRIAMEQFIPSGQQTPVCLSPHQEERFRLIFHILDRWCAHDSQKSIYVVIEMVSFFHTNWHLVGHYFEKSDFLVENMTLFQLLTKLVNQISPMYTIDGHAVSRTDKDLTIEEKSLDDIWAKLLSKAKPAPPRQPNPGTSRKSSSSSAPSLD